MVTRGVSYQNDIVFSEIFRRNTPDLIHRIVGFLPFRRK